MQINILNVHMTEVAMNKYDFSVSSIEWLSSIDSLTSYTFDDDWYDDVSDSYRQYINQCLSYRDNMMQITKKIKNTIETLNELKSDETIDSAQNLCASIKELVENRKKTEVLDINGYSDNKIYHYKESR